MAGSTTNEVILAALNQQIQAINDLITAIGNLALQVTVQSATPDVTLNCTPNVTLSPTINVTCGAGSAGSGPQQPPGDQGQTPPAGYTTPDPEVTDRKCKVANFLFDSVLLTVQKLAVMDADQYLVLGYVLTLSIVGGILGSEIPIAGTVVGAVAGAIVGIVTLLIQGNAVLDLGDLVSLLSGDHEALVNDLFNATDATDARQRFTARLTANGASLAEAALAGFLLPNDLTNLLFFAKEEYEPTLDGYDGAIDCSYQLVTQWQFTTGAQGWVFVDMSGNGDSMAGYWTEAEPTDPNDETPGHLHTAGNHVEGGTGSQGQWRYYFPVGQEPIVGEDAVFGFDAYNGQEGGGESNFIGVVYTDDSEVAGQWNGMGWIAQVLPLNDVGKAIKYLYMDSHNFSGYGNSTSNMDAAYLNGVS
jgi:hypothetical protein